MLAPKRSIGSLAFLGFGAVAAIIGLTPWLITGMRLPLQNLWASETSPQQMPVALLPFSQYYLSLTVALILIGSAVAGIVGRTALARNPRAALVSLGGGVLLIQVIATTQTALTVSSGLSDRDASTLYLVAVTGGTVAVILLGLGMLTLIARAPKAVALIALSIAAVAFSSWMSALVFPVGVAVSSSGFTDVASGVVRLSPAILIGAAIVWCGVSSVGRMIAAVVSLVVLWVGPALVTGVSAAAGSRVLAPYPSEMLDYGAGVFRSALLIPELWLPNLALTIGIAAIGLVARRTASRLASQPVR